MRRHAGLVLGFALLSAVSPMGASGIRAASAAALPGDTVSVDAQIEYLEPLPWHLTDESRPAHLHIDTGVAFEHIEDICVTARFEGDLLDPFDVIIIQIEAGPGFGWSYSDDESRAEISHCMSHTPTLNGPGFIDGVEVLRVLTFPDTDGADQSSFTLVDLEITIVGPLRSTECTIEGTPGDDTLRGTAGNDVICGHGGDDVISGFAGNDLIFGGRGRDIIYGGSGNDLIKGGPGSDRIFGGSDDDTILGGPGWDRLHGGADSDHIEGEQHNDRLFGKDGSDWLLGGLHQDRLFGGDNEARDPDYLFGQEAADRLYGGSGPDLMFGGPGNDGLWGGDGSDILNGGFGDDTICGQRDDDTNEPSPGDDTICGWDSGDQARGNQMTDTRPHRDIDSGAWILGATP